MRPASATRSRLSFVPNFRVGTEAAGETFTVRPQGELDIATSPQLDRALASAEGSAARTVILDLDGVSFIDAAGLHSILWAEERTRENGQSLRIRRGPDHVQRVFEICRVHERVCFE